METSSLEASCLPDTPSFIFPSVYVTQFYFLLYMLSLAEIEQLVLN